MMKQYGTRFFRGFILPCILLLGICIGTHSPLNAKKRGKPKFVRIFLTDGGREEDKALRIRETYNLHKAFFDQMVSPKHYDYSSFEIFSRDFNLPNIKREMEALAQELQPGDKVFVHIYYHGNNPAQWDFPFIHCRDGHILPYKQVAFSPQATILEPLLQSKCFVWLLIDSCNTYEVQSHTVSWTEKSFHTDVPFSLFSTVPAINYEFDEDKVAQKRFKLMLDKFSGESDYIMCSTTSREQYARLNEYGGIGSNLFFITLDSYLRNERLQDSIKQAKLRKITKPYHAWYEFWQRYYEILTDFTYRHYDQQTPIYEAKLSGNRTADTRFQYGPAIKWTEEMRSLQIRLDSKWVRKKKWKQLIDPKQTYTIFRKALYHTFQENLESIMENMDQMASLSKHDWTSQGTVDAYDSLYQSIAAHLDPKTIIVDDLRYVNDSFPPYSPARVYMNQLKNPLFDLSFTSFLPDSIDLDLLPIYVSPFSRNGLLIEIPSAKHLTVSHGNYTRFDDTLKQAFVLEYTMSEEERTVLFKKNRVKGKKSSLRNARIRKKNFLVSINQNPDFDVSGKVKLYRIHGSYTAKDKLPDPYREVGPLDTFLLGPVKRKLNQLLTQKIAADWILVPEEQRERVLREAERYILNNFEQGEIEIDSDPDRFETSRHPMVKYSSLLINHIFSKDGHQYDSVRFTFTEPKLLLNPASENSYASYSDTDNRWKAQFVYFQHFTGMTEDEITFEDYTVKQLEVFVEMVGGKYFFKFGKITNDESFQILPDFVSRGEEQRISEIKRKKKKAFRYWRKHFDPSFPDTDF
ncbi:MAG: hypothetical protein AAF587_07020 [Bacteroidota bacterium]